MTHYNSPAIFFSVDGPSFSGLYQVEIKPYHLKINLHYDFRMAVTLIGHKAFTSEYCRKEEKVILVI